MSNCIVTGYRLQPRAPLNLSAYAAVILSGEQNIRYSLYINFLYILCLACIYYKINLRYPPFTL
jgi:hypothetical protein